MLLLRYITTLIIFSQQANKIDFYTLRQKTRHYRSQLKDR